MPKSKWLLGAFDTDGEVTHHRKVAYRLSDDRRYTRYFIGGWRPKTGYRQDHRTSPSVSKAPKSQFKGCCWRTLHHEFRARQTTCGYACRQLADEALLRFASSIFKAGTYNPSRCAIILTVGALTFIFSTLRAPIRTRRVSLGGDIVGAVSGHFHAQKEECEGAWCKMAHLR